MKRLFTLFIAAGLLAGCTQSFTDGDAAYLGQTRPGSTPELFAQGIISTPDHEHSPLIFSPDSRQIIWSVIPVPLGTGKQDIFQVYHNGEKWSETIRLEFTAENRCGSPVLSPDGRFLYYHESIRNVGERKDILWRIERRDDFTWGQRRDVTGLIPEPEGRVCMRFCFAQNGNIYYDLGGPSDDGSWYWDIWMRAFHAGHYHDPVKLGGGINHGPINWTPFIAPDESYLIFSSNRMNNGDAGDHYISFRGDDGQWSVPVSMGTINTPRQERFPVVSPDGKVLFFARNMPENFSEIYWVDAGVIDELKSHCPTAR